jgi:hypothetical protein
VYFCFGTTHFCERCHSDTGRMGDLFSSGKLPQCPCGPLGKQLVGECPLGVKHPPGGQEFPLGCGVCRQAQTF